MSRKTIIQGILIAVLCITAWIAGYYIGEAKNNKGMVPYNDYRRPAVSRPVGCTHNHCSHNHAVHTHGGKQP